MAEISIPDSGSSTILIVDDNLPCAGFWRIIS
jgi:hypothetical protein